METVVLRYLAHNQEDNIGIYFSDIADLNRAVRTIKKARWSRTHRCWYVPLDKEKHAAILAAFKGIAGVEQGELRDYLEARKKGTVAVAPVLPIVPEKKEKPAPVVIYPQKELLFKKRNRIHAVNSHVLPGMEQHLKLKAYSRSTIRTYLQEMAQLLQTLQHISADELTPEHLKRYLVHCYEKLKLTENTLHSRINALKFYYEQVLGREKFFWEIPRPKKQVQLPRFFNQDEITAIIKAAGNIKHKTMLMLAYASGLRVSEVVRIQTKDIDSSRMCLWIRQAKGKKDRIVPLSPVLLIMLREYWKKYNPSVEGYLFPGQYKDEPYSTRSLQLVLAAAKNKAGILKPGSIHALRHSFATHLLDKGTDVTLIMKLLGHNDLKTTLRYLHVTNRDMLQIISPLDDLIL